MLKSELLIFDGAGFIGASIANYTCQHRRHQIASADALYTRTVQNLSPSLGSRRHRFYLGGDVNHSIKLNDLEKPRWVIFDGHYTSKAFLELWMRDILHQPEKILYLDAGEVLPAQAKNLYWMRIPKVFGPRQDSGQIPAQYMKEDLGGVPIDLPRDGTKKEWIYIKDLWNVLMQEMECDSEAGICSVSSGQFASTKDVYLYLRHKICGDVGAPVMDPTETVRGYEGRVIKSGGKDLLAALEHTAVWFSSNPWAMK